MKRRVWMGISASLLAACAPKAIQLPARTVVVVGDVRVANDLELRLVADNRAVVWIGKPSPCTQADPKVRVQVYDSDDIMLWEREFARFSFARLDEHGVLVALEGQSTFLAYDRDGNPRTDVPPKGPGIPNDALTVERFSKQKHKLKPGITIPEAAFGPPPTNPSDSNAAVWVERVAADRFASFDSNHTLRMTDIHNRVLWSMALPDATAVEFKNRQLVVSESAGSFRMSIDGELLSAPVRPAAVAYESSLAFERISAAPGGPLFVTSKGELLGAFDGKVQRLIGNAWSPIPKLTADTVLGFVEMQGMSPLVFTSYSNEAGGIELAILPTSGTEAQYTQDYPIDYSRFSAAHNKQTVVWSGYQSLVVVNGSDKRIQKLSATPAAVALFGERIFLEAREQDITPPPKTTSAGAVECPRPIEANESAVIAELAGDKLIKQPVEIEPPITAMGVEGDRLWVAGHRELAWLRAGKWEKMQSPLESVSEFWSPRAGILWAVGVGGVARFDGTTWRRVLGPNGIGVSVRGLSESDVWISTTSGFFHGAQKQSNAIEHAQVAGDPVATPARWLPVPLAPKPAKLVGVEFFALPKVGTKPFHPHAAEWMGEKLVLSNGTVHVLWDPKAPTRVEPLGKNGKSTLCFSCGAADDHGEPWVTRDGKLVTPKHPKVAAIVPDIGPIRAIAGGPSSLWVVGEVQSNIPSFGQESERALDHTPVQLALRAGGRWLQYSGLPPATYLSVSSAKSDDVWAAGALTWPVHAAYGGQSNFNLPGGEGIIAHVHGGRVEHFRSPLGPLWSVGQDGPNCAWAVGIAGQIVRVTDKVEGFTLADPLTLRDVAIVSPSERWVVGDRSTILHATSAGWETLESDRIPLDQSLTRVLLDKSNNVWILGYGGLYKVKPSR